MSNTKEVQTMDAGSKEAIFYIFCQLVDEIWHAADWLFPGTHSRFCQWSYRRELSEVRKQP